MFETSLTIQRPKGTTIATHINVQVDQTTVQEIMQVRLAYGVTSGDIFHIYTLGWYAASLIQLGDVLVDERNIDPLRNMAFIYNVVGRPKNFLRDHQEIYAQVFPGS